MIEQLYRFCLWNRVSLLYRTTSVVFVFRNSAAYVAVQSIGVTSQHRFAFTSNACPQLGKPLAPKPVES